jgi:hypothetical protein
MSPGPEGGGEGGVGVGVGADHRAHDTDFDRVVTPRRPEDVLYATSSIRVAVWVGVALLGVYVVWLMRADVRRAAATSGREFRF